MEKHTKKYRNDIGAMLKNILIIFINSPYTIRNELYHDPETYVLVMPLTEKIEPILMIRDQSPIVPTCLQHISSAQRTSVGKRCLHYSLRLRP